MLTKRVLDGLFRQVSGASFAVTYWDKTIERYGYDEPLFTLIFHEPCLPELLKGDLRMAFGEAYMDGKIDIEGDLASFIRLSFRNLSLVKDDSLLVKTASILGRVAHSARRSYLQQKQDVVHHYDLGNAFFSLWLDTSLTYSCAYYESDGDSLEIAQQQKIDYSLRKLRLQPGESLLDIGCGWGAVVMRAAEKWGVRAQGITLSEEQHDAGCAAISEKQLGELADVRLAHYQTLVRQNSQFDKIISIGMIEHVGKAHLEEYCQSVSALLRPGGHALLHMITSPIEGPMNPWVEKYIFPGSYVPTVSEMIALLQANGLLIHDVENLRPHYQKTLDEWSERFEEREPQVRDMFDERFIRMWRLYLRGTSASFAEAILEVHQILVSKGKSESFPLTREDLYPQAAIFGR